MKLTIILIFLCCSKLSFGQQSDTMAFDLGYSSCGETSFQILYYFENADSVVFHVDFGNNTDSTFIVESNFTYSYSVLAMYPYSGNYTVEVTAETTSGTLLDHKTNNFTIIGGEGCYQETIYKIRNDFSGQYITNDSIPIDFTGVDGITHTILPLTNFPNSYLTNPLLYPAQITANPAWLTAHNRVQLNPAIHFSSPSMLLPEDMYFGLGWPSLIISRTDVANVNNLMTLSPSFSFVDLQQENNCYLHLNNTLDAIPDSINRIRVEYDPFLQVSHNFLPNMTEGIGFIEFDVERLNLYQSIRFGLMASSAVSLDSIYFRCFYLNNTDQNAQDDTTSFFFESFNPCAGMTDSVLNISLHSTLYQFGNLVNSYLTASKNICLHVDSVGITVHYSPFLEYNNSSFQFSQVNDSTLHTFIPIYQYLSDQTVLLNFDVNVIPPGPIYVNYSLDLPDTDSTDNFTGDTLSFIACNSIDFSINSLSANMIAPTQSGTCDLSPIILSQCFLADTAEIFITFPGYVSMDSTALAFGTFTDSTFHFTLNWTNQNDYLQIPLHIPGTIPSGTPYTITAKIVGNNDIDTTNNTLSFHGFVLNSYDPNEKHADLPTNIDPDLQEKITYTIHFQNDGNLEAYNIVVRDTLSTNLDLSTLQFLGASHHCEMTLDVSTREVVFNFPNIMLVSSELDSLGSQGVFSYRISENANLSAGSIIENTAYIYFDFNPAIITNTTYHLNEASLGTDELTSERVILYPNPAEDNIRFSGAAVNEVSIYDLTGKLVLEAKNIPNNEVSFDLQTGIYQVVLKTENSTSNQKLVIKK